jgi:hypothetical protein
MPNRVIARFRDGKMLKGTTINFRPEAKSFHVIPPDSPYGEGVRVDMKDLKAVFFVRDLRGNPDYKEKKEFIHPPGYGRRVLVTFVDGEEMLGIVHTLDRQRAGFFLFPGDPSSNNERVFALFAAVNRLEYLSDEEAPGGAPTAGPQAVDAHSHEGGGESPASKSAGGAK